MNSFFTYVFLVGLLLTGLCTTAQETILTIPNTTMNNVDPLHIAQEYISTHLSDWGLTPDDIAEMTISDMYTDKSTGITRIYFLQQYKGIPVFNAILNVNMTKEGKVFFAANRFVSGLHDKINTTVPVIHPVEAVSSLGSHLGLTIGEATIKSHVASSNYILDKEGISREDITSKLSYQPHEGKVYLAWDILFAPLKSQDLWNARIDAVTGTVLNKNNWTHYCQIDETTYSREKEDCREMEKPTSAVIQSGLSDSELTKGPETGAKYNVWAAPYESPLDGPRTIVTDPYDPIASPFGWHDTNGQPGPEYTITGGNNVYVYPDRDNLGYSTGGEPDGGPELNFDFPFDPTWEPGQYTDAAVVNLFYWINFMHDFSYRFGFDEPAGNFQENNYGNGGHGSDEVLAVAQNGGNSDTLYNNATYTHRNEGVSPVIHCFEFIQLIHYVQVEEPASVAGTYIASLPNVGWGDGSYLTDVPLTGEVVLVNDGVEEPSTGDACQEIINVSEVAGKIAFIERGTCQFAFKALQAQNAGAIGVVFLNHENGLGTLGAGTDAPNVHIPVVMIVVHDARIIRQFAGQGLKISLVNPGFTPPERLSAEFQSTLIAHEYGHGISIRLAGGPNTTCLDNAEKMGEGWSDFFALVTTVEPGDTGEKKRGLNNYLENESNDQNGSRFYPYSTDMSVSPLTFADINSNQDVHERGEVWANMLWDMYWALVERYGWSVDLYEETSGNYIAIKLVMDGLKNVVCDPGFVDARNAIMAADEALYGGENSCLLWEVFARRGLGYSADQGSPFDAGDQVEAFDLPPVCTDQIIIEKSVTDFIQPGEEIQVTIKVGNYKNETVTNVVVKDIIPAGTSFKPNSSNYAVLKQGNNLLFDLGNMNFQEENTITYTLLSSPDAWSEREFLDDVPDENNNYWISKTLGSPASNPWNITDTMTAHSGLFCWNSPEVLEKSQQALILNPDLYTFHVQGQYPAMRFYHRYETLAGINGGIVEVREAGTTAWTQVSEYIVRNGYKGSVEYRTFILPDVKAFSGNSGAEYQATYIDLHPWNGKDIEVRFRFGTTANTHQGAGWLIDDIEFMELLSFNEEVCVTTDQGDYECAIAPEHGTIVDSREESVSTVETPHVLSAMIYPNPATEQVTIAISSDHVRDAAISLSTLDGKQLFTTSMNLSGHDYLHINTSSFAAGIYIVKVSTGDDQYVEKVIVQKM